MSKYVWAPGSHFPKNADPAKVAAELNRLGKRGRITPERVVEAAKNEKSALHPLVYDGTTAEQALQAYWIERAKYVLRSIVILEGEQETLEVRGFQLVTVDGEREYKASPAVRDDDELRAQVKEDLLRSLIAIQKRLRDWDQYSKTGPVFEPVIAAIDRVAA